MGLVSWYTGEAGGLELTCGIADGAVARLWVGRLEVPARGSCPLWEAVREEILEYLSGARRSFDLPVSYGDATPFRRAVWDQLRRIPYGETRTYGQIAAAIGRPSAARAVGQACHHNPVLLLVPCHRVVGAQGALTGFAGGLELKRRLLALEQTGTL